MALIESRIKGLALWHHLSVEQSEHSTGDQLAVLLKVQYMPDRSDNQIVLIAQEQTWERGEPTSGSATASLWTAATKEPARLSHSDN